MSVRLSVNVPEDVWRSLRDLAEQNRSANGRASVCTVVAKIIEQRLAAGKAESVKV